ncbi:MAG TPA: DUF1634 domain-containing protein [Terracidiphilus sp.]|jgi:uncharacterized membrane protein|nr:DUF1634 domain-containing protein [Terracidiphilus sp.]
MDDKRLESIIGQLLRAGVLLSAAIVTVGGILYLVRFHAVPANFHSFVVGGADIRTVPGILRSAAQLNSEGLMQAGLVLLILTPVARVALAVVGFAMERDRLYTVVSLIVLAILAFSLTHAG